MRMLRPLLAAGLVLTSTRAAAQATNGPAPMRADVIAEDPVIAAAPVALRLPASAVAASLGNVGIVSRDADVLFYNPGMLSQAAGIAASAQRFGTAATAASIASIQTLGGHAVGIGARFVDWSSSIGSTYAGALRPGSGVFSEEGFIRASSLALSAGVGRGIGPVRLGFAATYLREQYRESVDEVALFDIGAVMTVGPGFAGLTVQHMGRGLSLANPAGIPGRVNTIAPWRTTLGYGTRTYPISTFVDIAGVWQVSVDSEGEVRPAGGLELMYVPIEGLSFVGRVGARRPFDDAESAVTAGFGVSLDRVSLDYALDPYRQGAASHRIGIRVR